MNCKKCGASLTPNDAFCKICGTKVEDMERLSDDVSSVKGFYKNRILRVLLVFFLSSFGSMLGTFIGGADVASQLTQSFNQTENLPMMNEIQ